VVNFIGKMADPITKTFPIDLIIDNNGYNFRVGENIRVEALYTYDRPLHYIPKSCLVLSDDGEIAVRVIDENSIARRMRIIVRDEDEEGFWISGLHDEEDIITIGVAYVPDNQKVLAVRDDK
jgi:multidrug efflux system membrane fusion protein